MGNRSKAASGKRIRGTNRKDFLEGGEGNDTIFGLAGDDLLAGGADPGSGIKKNYRSGNDILLGGSGNDFLVGDTDPLFPGFKQDVGKDRLLGGSGNDTLDGGRGVDKMFGGKGSDLLSGYDSEDRDDKDIMRGGPGDDIYEVRSSKDQTIEKVNQGIDTVSLEGKRSGSWTLGANIENLYIGVEANPNIVGAFKGTGNELDNIIIGSSNIDFLQGLGGNDLLSGGAGEDTLSGGDGVDRFLFADDLRELAQLGTDTITDFVQGIDKIALKPRTFAALTTGVGQGITTEFASVADDLQVEAASAVIVFSRASQTLFYNQNGSAVGLGSGSKFAILTGVADLSATDFEMVENSIAAYPKAGTRLG